MSGFDAARGGGVLPIKDCTLVAADLLHQGGAVAAEALVRPSKYSAMTSRWAEADGPVRTHVHQLRLHKPRRCFPSIQAITSNTVSADPMGATLPPCATTGDVGAIHVVSPSASQSGTLEVAVTLGHGLSHPVILPATDLLSPAS
jgi:hypothetical protein